MPPSPPVPSSTGASDWGGGERVNEDGGGEGDSVADRGAEEDSRLTAAAGLGVVGLAAGTLASDPDGLPAGEAVLTIEAEAAVTSWAKLSGPVVLTTVGLSCLVDHWRRC